eukprot:gene7993-9388_t
MTAIAEREKLERTEQKKLARLQREAYRDSITAAGKLGQADDHDEQEGSGDEDDDDEDGLTPTVAPLQPTVQKITNASNIITTTITPLSFGSDDEQEQEDRDIGLTEEELEAKRKEEGAKKRKWAQDAKADREQKTAKLKKKKVNNKKDSITSENLTVFDAKQKIFVDDKGRKVMMHKEHGKLVPVVMSEKAENALDQGWKLPRALREKEKKSWSMAAAKKSRRTEKKTKK